MKPLEQHKTVIRTKRWSSKEECERYLAYRKPTGLSLLAARDYLEGDAKREARIANKEIKYINKEENK